MTINVIKNPLSNFYSNEYISLFLGKNDSIYEYRYQEKDDFFYNKSIKRPINKILDQTVDEGYFDLESVYGYSGYISNSLDQEFIKRAIQEYKKDCIQKKIVAEFIRFSPFNNFANKFSDSLDYYKSFGDNVIVDLESDIDSNYKKKARYLIRKASENLEVSRSHNIDLFIELYYQTMNKNNASSFYFFDKSFFKNLIKLNFIKMFKVVERREVVSMAIFLLDNKNIYYYLSANTPQGYKLNANFYLLDQVIRKFKSNGLQKMILGGGSSPDKDDNLLQFKKKFSSYSEPFITGGMIFINKKYESYNRIYKHSSGTANNFFLNYRYR